MTDTEAVTFDFFNTLVFHRRGPRGRGFALMQYLDALKLESDDWAHQVMYDVFEPHAREYSVQLPAQQKTEYRVRLAERVFQRLNVRGRSQPADHAAEIWDLIGPGSLEVFPDVWATLEQLKASGYHLGIVSNWQCGLSSFCEELGLAQYFEHIVSSAEMGFEKPATQIFDEMFRLLGVSPDRVLHVGDTMVDDVEGAHGVGAAGLLICREAANEFAQCRTITSLHELLPLLAQSAS